LILKNPAQFQSGRGFCVLLGEMFTRSEMKQKCSWLGFLNFYILQWTGFRLSYELDDSNPPKKIKWGFVKMKPGSNWIK
jgi:hypothetical protein